METEIIRHKTVEEYFKGFYPPDMVERYAFQLRRMFESGAAKEGDYFVVKDDGRPFLNAEIYRTNTRRIWDKPPGIAADVPGDDDRIRTAVEKVLGSIDDLGEYDTDGGILEIVIDTSLPFSGYMKNVCKDYGYKLIDKRQLMFTEELESEAVSINDSALSIKKLTEINPGERFRAVAENDRIGNILPLQPEKLYQDYLELGYISEELWRIIYFENEVAGVVMPVFSSGIKDRIELINYFIAKNPEIKILISDLILSLTLKAALINGIGKIEALIDTKDVQLTDKFAKKGFKKRTVLESYIK